MAAPRGDVTIPIVRGRSGRGFLRAGVEKALGPELLLELFEGELEGALALGLDDLDDDLVLAPRLVDVDPSAADDLEAVLEVEGRSSAPRSGT